MDDYEDDGEDREGLFGFFLEDKPAMDELDELLRALINQAGSSPRQIFHLAKLLFAVQRFPLPTTGLAIELSFGASFENGESSAQTLFLDDTEFRLGGADYVILDPSVGGDSSSDTVFEVDVAGERATVYDLALIEWIEEFRGRMEAGDQELRIWDHGDPSELDWDAERGEPYWEKLRSEHT